MKANKIADYLESFFPLHLQEPWDKCGLQIGTLSKEVNKVMVALNADIWTIQKAISEKCDMLITHHPFLLEKIETIDVEQTQGKCMQLAMQHDLVIYSLHTCLDQGKDGISMNDWLIQLFDVEKIEKYDNVGIGKKGILKEPMDIETFVEKTKKILQIQNIRYASGTKKNIEKIAICGGSGGDDIEIVAKQVDAFITGDTKYRHAKYAIDHNIALLDIGHHCEVIMEEKLQALLQTLNIEIVLANSKDYYQYK